MKNHFENLEESATQYAINTPAERVCPACSESTAWPVDKHAFIAGAEWARKQFILRLERGRDPGHETFALKLARELREASNERKETK